MVFFKQLVVLLVASVAVIATAQEAKETPKAVQVVLAVSAKADAQAEAELKAAQLKALAKKIEGRKAAIKAAESAIRSAAIKGDPALEALVATKSELQAQIKELEESATADAADAVVLKRPLQVEMAAALAAKDHRRALRLLQGTWKNNGRSGRSVTMVIRGNQVMPTDGVACALSVRNGMVHYSSSRGDFDRDLAFQDDTVILGVDTYTRVK